MNLNNSCVYWILKHNNVNYTYEVGPNDSYIIKKANGDFFLHTEQGEILLDENTINQLEHDGFAVYREE